jgi:hypothetical protein
MMLLSDPLSLEFMGWSLLAFVRIAAAFSPRARRRPDAHSLVRVFALRTQGSREREEIRSAVPLPLSFVAAGDRVVGAPIPPKGLAAAAAAAAAAAERYCLHMVVWCVSLQSPDRRSHQTLTRFCKDTDARCLGVLTPRASHTANQKVRFDRGSFCFFLAVGGTLERAKSSDSVLSDSTLNPVVHHSRARRGPVITARLNETLKRVDVNQTKPNKLVARISPDSPVHHNHTTMMSSSLLSASSRSLSGLRATNTMLTGDNNSSSSSHSGGVRKLSGTEDDDEMLVLDNGGSTPNDVRHFPPSPSPQSSQSQSQQQSHPYLLSASMNVLGNERRGQRSAAVPISQLDRSPHKLGHDEERMLMEYRESLMYSRIVDFHQSRRRTSLQMAETTATVEEEDATTKATLPLLLRPRAHYQQDLSLGEMLSNRPRPHPHETLRRRPGTMNAAGADLFPLRGDDPSSSVGDDEHEDDDDDEDDSDHDHHHEEVFDLDL